MYFLLTLLCGCESNHSQATPPIPEATLQRHTAASRLDVFDDHDDADADCTAFFNKKGNIKRIIRL